MIIVWFLKCSLTYRSTNFMRKWWRSHVIACEDHIGTHFIWRWRIACNTPSNKLYHYADELLIQFVDVKAYKIVLCTCSFWMKFLRLLWWTHKGKNRYYIKFIIYTLFRIIKLIFIMVGINRSCALQWYASFRRKLLSISRIFFDTDIMFLFYL